MERVYCVFEKNDPRMANTKTFSLQNHWILEKKRVYVIEKGKKNRLSLTFRQQSQKKME